jgi:hypothetical protein
MSVNYSPNWGSSIDPYYETQATNNSLAVTRSTAWLSAHNAGWGQSIAVWVKI